MGTWALALRVSSLFARRGSPAAPPQPLCRQELSPDPGIQVLGMAFLAQEQANSPRPPWGMGCPHPVV